MAAAAARRSLLPGARPKPRQRGEEEQEEEELEEEEQQELTTGTAMMRGMWTWQIRSSACCVGSAPTP